MVQTTEDWCGDWVNISKLFRKNFKYSVKVGYYYIVFLFVYLEVKQNQSRSTGLFFSGVCFRECFHCHPLHCPRIPLLYLLSFPLLLTYFACVLSHLSLGQRRQMELLRWLQRLRGTALQAECREPVWRAPELSVKQSEGMEPASRDVDFNSHTCSFLDSPRDSWPYPAVVWNEFY